MRVYYEQHPDKDELDNPHGKWDSKWTEIVSSLITWIQNSKARALTDLLGLVAQIPASMMAEAAKSPGALALLGKEQDLMAELQRALIGRKLIIHRELLDIRKQ